MFGYLLIGAMTGGISYAFHERNGKAILHGLFWPFLLLYLVYIIFKYLTLEIKDNYNE